MRLRALNKPKLVMPAILSVPVFVFLLVCALACNVVLYYQAKDVVKQQAQKIDGLKSDLDSLHHACRDKPVWEMADRMKAWELKHGYRKGG